jgi:hypothetical protein
MIPSGDVPSVIQKHLHSFRSTAQSARQDQATLRGLCNDPVGTPGQSRLSPHQ